MFKNFKTKYMSLNPKLPSLSLYSIITIDSKTMTYKQAFSFLGLKVIKNTEPKQSIVIITTNVDINRTRIQSILNTIHPFEDYTLILRFKLKEKKASKTKIKSYSKKDIVIITNYI